MLLLKQAQSTPFAAAESDLSIGSHARSVRLARSELQIDIVETAEGLQALQADWNDLFERAGRPDQVFQTHGFVSLFVRIYGIGHRRSAAGCSCSLAIVTARRYGKLVLAWPLIQRREFGLTILSWLGEPVAQYGDVVLDPAERARETLLAAWDHAQRRLAPDLVRLRKVRADAAVMPLLTALDVTASDVVQAPCITLAGGGSSFEARQSSKAKKNRRRLLRRLEEQGAVSFREIETCAGAHSAIKAGLADKREWLARRGLLSPALSDARFDAFMTAAVCDARDSTGGAAFSLALDGRPIALALGFRVKGRLMLHLISYAADVEKHGAGVINLEAVLRLAEAEGLQAVDLLPPKADYKLDWADACVDVGDYGWGATARGKLWRALFDGFARPRAKQMFAGMPLGMRQRFTAKAATRKPEGACPPLDA